MAREADTRRDDRRVLVIDDEESVRTTLAAILAREFEVEIAASAEEGLELLRERHFAVVLCDFALPGMDGDELLARVADERPDVARVMMTGLRSVDVAERATNQGRAVRFLAKPCGKDVLLATIGDAWSEFRQRVRDRRRLEELRFSKDSLERFNALLGEQVRRQTSSLRRLHDYSLALAGACGLAEIATLVAHATYEVLGRRGVHVQVWDRDEVGHESNLGPEMSPEMHRVPLVTPDGVLGEIAVDVAGADGSELGPTELDLLSSIASAAAVSANNEARRRERDRAQFATIVALARLAERRDNETGKHLDRVSEYCRLIAEQLRGDPRHGRVVTDEYIADLVRSAPLHDIGKVGIPDSILLKRGKLSPAEWEVMKTHARMGGETLDGVIREYNAGGFLRMGRDIAMHHHECWDGSGYPDGLKGERIPLAARILAIADVYDALTTLRPYKEAWGHERAVAQVAAGAGTKLDPDCVAAFLTCAEGVDAIRERLADDVEDVQALFGSAPSRAA